MTPSADEPDEPDENRYIGDYYRRDVEEFHREANVLAGHDPEDVSADPPENLRGRRLMVFAIIVVVGLLAGGMAVALMALPQCENPPYSWMPCVPDL